MKPEQTLGHLSQKLDQYQLIRVQVLGFTAECSDHGYYDSDKAILL